MGLVSFMLLFPTLWFIFLLGKHLRFQDELILTMVNAIALSLVAFIVDSSFQGVCHYSSAETCVQDSGFVYLALLVMFPLFFENVAGIVNLFIFPDSTGQDDQDDEEAEGTPEQSQDEQQDASQAQVSMDDMADQELGEEAEMPEGDAPMEPPAPQPVSDADPNYLVYMDTHDEVIGAGWE